MRIPVMMKWLLVLCCHAVCHASAEIVADDYHLLPKGPDEVKSLEEVLKSRLSATQAATVCVQLGANSGTGVVVSADGLVLSAAHVVMGVKRRMEVVFSDGSSYEAHSLGVNADNDAAMLQIVDPPKDLPYVRVWKSDANEWSPKTTMGSWVFALGHSGGFNEKRGAVLRLGRVLRISKDTLETDCSLIGGDSGGPLFNLDGQLVAIHSRVGRRVVKNMHVPVTAFTRDWQSLLDGEFMGDGPFVEPPTVEEQVLGASVYQAKNEVVVSAGFAIDGDGRPILVAGDQIVSCGGDKVAKVELLRDFLNDVTGEFRLEIMRGDKLMSFEVNAKKGN